MALLYDSNGKGSKEELVLCFRILHDSLSGLSFLHAYGTGNESLSVSAGRLQSAVLPLLRAILAGLQT